MPVTDHYQPCFGLDCLKKSRRFLPVPRYWRDAYSGEVYFDPIGVVRGGTEMHVVHVENERSDKIT